MLSTQHKQYIIKHFVITSAFINALINGVVGYALFSGQAHIALWGSPSLAGDIIATVFLLTLIASVLVSWGVNLALVHSRIDTVEAKGVWGSLLARLPSAAWPRAFLFSTVATCVIAPVVLFAFHLMAIQSLATVSAITFKILFSVAVGLLVTPLMGLLAMSRKSV